MGSFSWKLARKWTQGVLLEICMFSYTSNAAGESQEVLYWLMQKYVKWWNATGNWNYFPTTFTLLNAAAVPATSYWGQEAWLLCQPPGFLHARAAPGMLRLAGLWLPLVCTTSPWCLGSTSSMALPVRTGQGGRGVSFRLLWEFSPFPKQGGFSPVDWEGKLSKPCVYLCWYIKYRDLNILCLELYVSVK